MALLFCGTGDARNVFTTIMMLNLVEFKTEQKVCKDLHITVLDLKPAAIARTLVFCEMLATYAVESRTAGEKVAKTLRTFLAYLYFGQVVPAAANGFLQRSIKTLIKSLESGEELPVTKWAFVPHDTRKAVLYVLRQWQNPPKEPYYTAPLVRKTILARIKQKKCWNAFYFGETDIPKGLREDRKFFDDVGVILPPAGFADTHDPTLAELIRDYNKGAANAIKKLTDHLDKTWAINLTLFDFDFVEAFARSEVMPSSLMSDADKVPCLELDPLDQVSHLPSLGGRAGKGIVGIVGRFFDAIAVNSSILAFNDRLRVEFLVGEMVDTMDRLRYDCLPSRKTIVRGVDPSTFPRRYDRIHMSNVP